MAKIWRWVAMLGVFLLLMGLVLVGVAYATGGSVDRVMATTDIMDLTKYVSRDQLEAYVTQVFELWDRVVNIF